MMPQNFYYQQIFITEYSESSENLKKLFYIFALTLKPDISFKEFKAYFFASKLDYIDVTFILDGEKIIGFTSAAFYKTTIDNKKYTIGRAATGILENYRGSTLPKWKLYSKYIRYWLKHPFRLIVLTAYVANPLIYAMISKYTGISYPKANANPPKEIINLKDRILKSQNLSKKESPAFVVQIHFCVKISKLEQQRIFRSKDVNVQYYLNINPNFMQQSGVIVIIPINLSNIILSTYKFTYFFSKKYILNKTQKPALKLGQI